MRQSGIRRVATAIGATLSLAAFCCHGAGKPVQWSYGGPTGPAKWGALNEAFETCKLGELQSPIDIPATGPRVGDLPSLLFDYKPTPLKIIDTGHTIQVNYSPGSFLMVSGKKYELVEFHFHKPSEEKINGRGHDMVAHLVHQGPDKQLGIAAVFLDAGDENKLLKAVWDNMPRDKGHEKVVEGITINALDLLPKNRGYYTFSGSLTTPPCTEDVTWFVLKTPVTVSNSGMARFGSLYPMNARPVQPVNNRDIQVTR